MKMFFLRNENGVPVVCVATELKDDKVYYGLAKYHPIIHKTVAARNGKPESMIPISVPFDRKMAKTVAVGRLCKRIEKDQGSIPMDKGVKVKLIQAIAADETLRQSTRDIAVRWLETAPARKEIEDAKKKAKAARRIYAVSTRKELGA